MVRVMVRFRAREEVRVRVGETLTAMTLAMMSELNMATMTPRG